MKKVRLVVSMLAVTFYFGVAQGVAQRGPGGATGHSGGGHGAMTMPQGRPGPSEGHGMPGMERGGRPDMNQGKPTGTGRMEHGSDAMGQRTVAEHLAANPKLSTRIEALLPAGANLSEAASGFKNLGDFVAAAHVSQNLGIPFGELKTKITGGKSLGEAIHELRPDVNHNAEAKKAKEQAQKALKDMSS